MSAVKSPQIHNIFLQIRSLRLHDKLCRLEGGNQNSSRFRTRLSLNTATSEHQPQRLNSCQCHLASPYTLYAPELLDRQDFQNLLCRVLQRRVLVYWLIISTMFVTTRTKKIATHYDCTCKCTNNLVFVTNLNFKMQTKNLAAIPFLQQVYYYNMCKTQTPYWRPSA